MTADNSRIRKEIQETIVCWCVPKRVRDWFKMSHNDRVGKETRENHRVLLRTKRLRPQNVTDKNKTKNRGIIFMFYCVLQRVGDENKI